MDPVLLVQNLALLFDKWGYAIIFLGSLIEITPLGWTIPGGLILAMAGFFSNGNGEINLALIIIFGTLGAWITFILAYLLGKKTGMWLVKKLRQEKNANLARTMLKKHGGAILTTSMMANLTRFWMAYIAGVENYNFFNFLKYSLIASLGWVSLMTVLGFLAGFERGNIENLLKSVGIVAWIFLFLAIYVLVKSIRHEYKHFKEDEPHNESNK